MEDGGESTESFLKVVGMVLEENSSLKLRAPTARCVFSVSYKCDPFVFLDVIVGKNTKKHEASSNILSTRESQTVKDYLTVSKKK